MGTKLDDGVALLKDLSKEELISIIVDDAKNWLAHDGLWFQAVEQQYGIDTAIEIDTAAWEKFTVVEAKAGYRHWLSASSIDCMHALTCRSR